MDSTNGVRSKTDSSVEESINTINQAMPPFNSNIHIWIKQVEMVFEMNKINSERSKFLRLASSLPTETLSRHGLYIDSSSCTPYSDLKSSLLRSNNISETTRIRELLNIQDDESTMPSQSLQKLLSQFRSIEPKTDWTENNIIRAAFIQTIPQTIRATVASKKTANIYELANFADNLMQFINPPRTTLHTFMTTESDEEAGIQVVNNRNQKFSKDYRTMKTESMEQNKSTENTICFYHRTFGKLARKCQSPCYWKRLPGNDKASH